MPSIRDFEEPHNGKAHKSWIFTLNNYTENQCDFIKGLEGITKMAVGKEIGESGTPHLQGVMTWKTPKRFSQLHKLLPHAHFEKCRDLDMAFNYCRKELNMLCDINNSKQGKRSDLAAVVDAVKEGNTEFQLWSEHSTAMVRYHRGVLALKSALAPPISYPVFEKELMPLHTDWSKSLIVYGEPDVGKTRWAEQHFRGGFLMVSHLDRLADFNPALHEGILFDDIEFASWMPRTSQIHLVDVDDPRDIHIRYKIAHIPRNTKKIFCTNTLNFLLLEDEAIRRRVTVTEVVKGNTKLSPSLRYLRTVNGKDWFCDDDYP